MLLLDCSPSAIHLYYSDEKETEHVTPKFTKSNNRPAFSYDESPDEVVVWTVQFFGGQKLYLGISQVRIRNNRNSIFFFPNAFIGLFTKQGTSVQVSSCSPVHWLAWPMTSRLYNRDKKKYNPKKIKGKVHPCTGTEVLYRSYGP